MKSISINSSPKRIFLALLILLLIVVGLFKIMSIGPFHKSSPKVVSGASFNTKGEKKTSDSSVNSVHSNSSGTVPSDKTIGTTATLYSPTGGFVSNHRPNLGGYPAPNTISSTCSTTPGATCKIVFTKDRVSKELSAQTTDGNGSVYWNWKLQSVGLTEGIWKIKAVATLGDQTKESQDSIDLVVAQ
jgi:hypothetical protein